jgi:hypothetical protein
MSLENEAKPIKTPSTFRTIANPSKLSGSFQFADRERNLAADRVLRRLTAATGIFAILAATLLGIGKGSMSLPLLVSAAVVLSWVYTDWLGWIRLHKYAAYALMAVAGGYLSYLYVTNLQTDKRMIFVAQMLIWVQIPLFFTVKHRRVFEQIGVFLLLELVVSALVNDNVLFGLMLLPALIVGSAVMVSFGQYVGLSGEGAEISRRFRWLDYLRVFLGGTSRASTENRIHFRNEMRNARPIRAFLDSFPLTLTIISFAAIFFYFLPRTQIGSFRSPNFSASPSVGFSERMTLAQMGEVLQNDQPVFRLSLTDEENGSVFKSVSPPYIRGAALSVYLRDGAESEWMRGNYEAIRIPGRQARVPNRNRVRPSTLENSELTKVNLKEFENNKDSVLAIAPFFTQDSESDFVFKSSEWTLRSVRDAYQLSQRPRDYTFYSTAFENGLQSRYLMAANDFLRPDDDEALERFRNPERLTDPEIAALLGLEDVDRAAVLSDIFSVGQLSDLLRFSKSRFRSLQALRDRVIESQGLANRPLLNQALAVESHFIDSGEFQYTLDLSMERRELIDAVEDFVRNQKRGHCQYFASAMCLTLRSMGIPSRTVVGFRPQEFNSIGGFYLVRQRDAHAWAEGFLTRAQLDEAGVELPETFAHGAWVRFDATPGSVGETALPETRSSRIQALEAAQEYWDDYVFKMDKSRQSGVFDLFSNSAESQHKSYFERLQNWIVSLQASQLSSEGFTINRVFSWPTAAITIVLVGLGVLVYQFTPSWMLPTHFIRLTRRLDPDRNVNIPFYQRVLKSFRRLGWRREESTTMGELNSEVAQWMSQQSIDSTQKPDTAALLTAYYDVRFGGKDLVANESAIDKNVSKLEELSRRLRR